MDIKSIKDRSIIGVSMGSSLGSAVEIGEAYMMVENMVSIVSISGQLIGKLETHQSESCILSSRFE